MPFTVAQASSFYRIPVIDWGRTRAQGLLIASGSGLLMSVMDQVPELRWAVDFDALKGEHRLDDFLTLVAPVVSPLGMCGWFTITNPDRIRKLIARDDAKVIVYGGNVRFGTAHEVDSLRDFVDAMRAP